MATRETSKCSSFSECINASLQYQGFHLPTKRARAALQCSTSLWDWVQCPHNLHATEEFYAILAGLLSTFLHSATRPDSNVPDKSKMWASYQAFIVSETFRKLWDTVYETASVKSNILVLQYITLILHDKLIVDKFPLPSVTSTPIPDLTNIEENALRYVCGYMVKAVKKQIGKWGKSRPEETKDTLQFGLECMIEHVDGGCSGSEGDGGGSVDSECGESSSSDWLKSIDRGRLVHVSDDCYKVFYYMELGVRRHLHDISQALYEQAGSKTAIVQDMMSDVDVLYYWDICQCELGQDERKELLTMVVQHYVTVRGYSFARSLLEKFKTREKKSTQKSMAMRKKVSSKP